MKLMGCTCSQEHRGSDHHLLMSPSVEAVVCPCLWSSRWQQQPAPAPSPLSRHPQQWHPASLVSPGFFQHSLGYGALPPSPLRLSPCSQPSSCPWLWLPKPRLSIHPYRPSGQASQTGACQAVVPTTISHYKITISHWKSLFVYFSFWRWSLHKFWNKEIKKMITCTMPFLLSQCHLFLYRKIHLK